MGSTQLKSDRLSGAEVSSLESLLQQVENESLMAGITWLPELGRDENTTFNTIVPRSERFICK
ncbi:hypothetical protein ORJ04_07900 [Rheinheimera baltica]|uniref:Uncharacterized protein n=1 Tax=Rheinheimera baltica TaxID=67576 RepID=A0ABT9HYJ1_9GAMM|nr:hypothetical protein [Rheinheimera baltica]MDP5135870.1 hypothetical protein [Rheinheimera baltica]